MRTYPCGLGFAKLLVWYHPEMEFLNILQNRSIQEPRTWRYQEYEKF
jgi:hypothetical protein